MDEDHVLTVHPDEEDLRSGFLLEVFVLTEVSALCPSARLRVLR